MISRRRRQTSFSTRPTTTSTLTTTSRSTTRVLVASAGRSRPRTRLLGSGFAVRCARPEGSRADGRFMRRVQLRHGGHQQQPHHRRVDEHAGRCRKWFQSDGMVRRKNLRTEYNP
uniref:Uncharacterized protein n=1 Tax=Acrobeloides nanus TaxID=290746 RepID=A0A914CSW5_9BILA